jgi:hypothetical protein
MTSDMNRTSRLPISVTGRFQKRHCAWITALYRPKVLSEGLSWMRR